MSCKIALMESRMKINEAIPEIGAAQSSGYFCPEHFVHFTVDRLRAL